MAGARVAVIDSKGCSRLFFGISSSFASLGSHHFVEPMSPSSSVAACEPVLQATGPFTGLVICVTGLSKEARKQVMAATERLGGQYSSDLHPQCTHLVVQSFGGRKFEHALKHGSRNGLFVVTLGWFVDSVRRNIRLSESLYSVKNAEENGLPMKEVNQITGFTGNENSCIPTLVPGDNKSSYLTRQSHLRPHGNEYSENKKTSLAGACIYVDSNISSDLRTKVVDAAVREGANFVDHWFIGCSASHAVCEGTSVQKYIGHANNLVTPLWVIKTAKEKSVQRLVHLSSDLARQVGMILQNFENGIPQQDTLMQDAPSYREPPGYMKPKENLEGRKQKIELAKMGVRTRRARRMQIPIRPITPSTLLDSICWSISDPTLTASVYTGSSPFNDVNEHTSVFFDARGDGRDSEASFDNFTRPLKESEKEELIFKNQFLTILFPIDRFGEMGPSSRSFFSEGGFTCKQVLDHIYSFYQENMSTSEIDVAIHTDSRHADRLRSIFASKESIEQGVVLFKRIDFMGSRRSLEMLKRILGDKNSNVYELLIRA